MTLKNQQMFCQMVKRNKLNPLLSQLEKVFDANPMVCTPYLIICINFDHSK